MLATFKSQMSYLLIAVVFTTFLYGCKKKDTTKTVRDFYENGRLERQYFITGGKKQGPFTQYYSNGQLERMFNYVNGEMEGEQRQYYIDGSTQAIGYYWKGKIDSIVRWFYPHNKLKSETFRLNGKLFGIQKEYFEDGSLKDLYFMINDSDQLFSFDFDTGGKLVNHNDHFMYCIYNNNQLHTGDTAAMIFYTIVPPGYTYTAKILERDGEKPLSIEEARLETINNNQAVLLQRSYQVPGIYSIGFTIALRSKSRGKPLNDTSFVTFTVR
jgi:hypothetical protein